MFSGLKKQYDLGDNLISELISDEHALVRLKLILNWEKMNEIYKSCYESEKGNATKHTELVLGLLILKFVYNKSYRILIDELHTNLAFMHLCSVSIEDILELRKQEREEGKKKQLIDHSTLSKITKRLGSEKIQKIERTFFNDLKEKKIIKGKHLFSDTTSLENNIIYPTEISLLKRVIEQASIIIQKVMYKKDLVKSDILKKANQIAKVYYSASKKTKELLHNCSKGLINIASNAISKAEESLHNCKDKLLQAILRLRYSKLVAVGNTIIDQVQEKINGNKVSDKIVNYFEDHARSLPKGKLNRPCEFGVKMRIDMSGNNYITNYKLYLGNIADVTMLEDSVKEHAKIFGQEFKGGSMDRAFYDEDRIKKLENKYNIDLAIAHKKDRNKKMSKIKEALYRQRAAIEAKISEGKRMCGLGKSLFKGFDGDKIWASFSVMALNIRKLLRDIIAKPTLMNIFK